MNISLVLKNIEFFFYFNMILDSERSEIMIAFKIYCTLNKNMNISQIDKKKVSCIYFQKNLDTFPKKIEVFIVVHIFKK